MKALGKSKDDQVAEIKLLYNEKSNLKEEVCKLKEELNTKKMEISEKSMRVEYMEKEAGVKDT